MPKNIQTLVDDLDHDLSSLYDADDSEIDEAVVFPLCSSLKNNLNYLDEVEIDRGGEKRIFKAYDPRSDRHIALARPLKDSKENEERFLREARICAGLEHPNIIPVYDIELDDDEKPFFTMELLKGQTLKDLLKDHHRSVECKSGLAQLLDIFVKVCDAVAFAHSKNVLHLDVKPENINVGEYGQVLLIDWGLAKILNDSLSEDLFSDDNSLDMDLLNDMTQVGTLKGSPGFMAPEQAETKGVKTSATDIYSLGALLYSILTAEMHVQGESIEELLVNTRQGELRDFPKDKYIPDSLKAVFYKACQLKPEERYDSVESLKGEIQSFLRGYATQAEEAGFLKLLKLVYHRNRIRCQLIFGFLIFSLLGTSLFIQALRESEAEAIVARNKAETALVLYEKEKRGRESIIADFDESLENFKENLGSSSNIEDHFNRLLVGTAISSSRQLDFDMALALTELAIQKNPNDYNAIAEKGFIHLVRHEFNKANGEFRKCSTHTPHIYDLIRIANDYAQIKPNDEKRLTNKQFLELVRTLPDNRSWLKHYMLVYDHKVNPSLQEHSELVKGYLLMLNPELDEKNFNFNFIQSQDGNRLDLSGNSKLHTLKNMGGKFFPYRSILRTLDLKYLDLSHSGLLGFQPIVELDLKELNLAHTPIKYFKFLSEFKEVPKLYLSKSQGFNAGPTNVKPIIVE
ncbi:serine/threonine-protein kinase [Lentisphaera marina]|uniref:serine/threonine protein kinase n=1 Tax=Lentisphaera marina TaxID=1111041 RepID=UPI0023671F3B|nr:serine/threonine-protein kinase [Lentisphaera marina]MDD7986157.1 serine/threonine-protein kinase [Lentisphaera marina]